MFTNAILFTVLMCSLFYGLAYTIVKLVDVIARERREVSQNFFLKSLEINED